MAKEKRSAAFQAFLGGTAAVKGIQDQQFKKGQLEKNRVQAEELAEAQRKSVANNLKIQIDAANKRHTEKLTQATNLHKEGLLHSRALQTENIQGQISRHETTLEATKTAAALMAKAGLDYRRGMMYDQARDTQLAFEKQGISGELDDSSGYARFIPNEFQPEEVSLSTLGSVDKPIRSEIPSRNPLQQALASIKGGLQMMPFNIAVEGGIKETMSTGIQSSDLYEAEKYGKQLTKIIDKNPAALQDPRMILALDAVDKIIERSDFSREAVEKDAHKASLRDLKAYIRMLRPTNND